jgi:hypothetical protein
MRDRLVKTWLLIFRALTLGWRCAATTRFPGAFSGYAYIFSGYIYIYIDLEERVRADHPLRLIRGNSGAIGRLCRALYSGMDGSRRGLRSCCGRYCCRPSTQLPLRTVPTQRSTSRRGGSQIDLPGKPALRRAMVRRIGQQACLVRSPCGKTLQCSGSRLRATRRWSIRRPS